jgi:hypothetical protein
MARYPDTASPSPAVHRSIIVIDIVGFSGPQRTHRDQLLIRTALYNALEHAFHQAGILWHECYREDRGDGVLILAPPHIPKEYLATRLPHALATTIARHNNRHCAPARIQVRLALHAGEITYDTHGVSSPALVHAFRLLDAPSFKKEVATFRALVGLIVSAWYFEEVIQQLHAHSPPAFHRVRVHTRSAITIGWVTHVHTTPQPSELANRTTVYHLDRKRPALQATTDIGTSGRRPVGRHRARQQVQRRQILVALIKRLFVKRGNGPDNSGSVRTSPVVSPRKTSSVIDEPA